MDIIDSTFAEFAENDLNDLWDSDYYAEALRVASEVDWSGMLEGGPGGGGGGGGGGSAGVVLNDRLMTEASLGVISQLSSLGGLGGLSSFLAAHQHSSQHLQEGGTGGVVNLPGVKVEHSYSLSGRSSPTTPHTSNSPLSDLESECFPAIPISEAEGANVFTTGTTTTNNTTTNNTTNSTTSSSTPTPTTTIIVREPADQLSSATTTTASSFFRRSLSHPPPLSPLVSEPPDDDDSCDVASFASGAFLSVPSLKTSLGLVRPSAVVVTQRHGSGGIHCTTSSSSISSTSSSKLQGLSSALTIRMPPSSALASTSFTTSSPSSSSAAVPSSSSSDSGCYFPPTPPSCSSSDSECGGQSPARTLPLYETLTPQFCNPRKAPSRVLVSTRNPINTPLISSQPKGATGAINLTEEEKRTLLSEGYNVPARLPLTKAEEKSLKKIRRKIKNKISAQESRRKKKDYMDALERKVEKLSSENMEFKRRIDVLQNNNSQLMMELQRLQVKVEAQEKHRIRSSPIATLLS